MTKNRQRISQNDFIDQFLTKNKRRTHRNTQSNISESNVNLKEVLGKDEVKKMTMNHLGIYHGIEIEDSSYYRNFSNVYYKVKDPEKIDQLELPKPKTGQYRTDEVGKALRIGLSL